MLQSMRDNSQSIVAKIIVGFIIVTFALWGVDSLVGLANAPDAPIEVNGEEISEQQVLEGIELQRRQLLAQMGEGADPNLLEDSLLRGMVVEGLIQQELLLQNAREQGMAVSAAQLDRIILSTPDFQVDGQFDRNRFESLLRNVGLTPLMYRDYLRRETLIAQERGGLVTTALALPSEVQYLAELDRQTRDLSYLKLDVEPYLNEVALDEAEVADYYEANRTAYTAPEQVSIEYLLLDKESVAQGLQIEDAQLQSEYQGLLDTFEADEARQAAHILIQANGERSETEARALAEELAAKLEAGADFADLAREYSEDPGSAEEGGDLGYVEQGVMMPAFEQALFALEVGEVSEPVKTDFGYHLIRLEAVSGSEPPTFQQARSSLLSELRSQRAESLFVARAEELADISFSAADLREPAEVLDLEIQTSALFGRSGGGSELLTHPRVLEAAFDPEVLTAGHNSQLIELDADRMLVLRVKEHREAQIRPLDAVRDQIETTLVRQKATEQLRTRGQEMMAAVQKDGLEALTQFERSWEQQEAVSRGEPGLDGEILNHAFRMARPESGPTLDLVTLEGGGLALLAVTAVQEPDALALSEQERQGLAGFIANRYGQADYQALVQHLRANAEVVLK